MTIRNQKDFWAGLMFMAFGFAMVIIAVFNYQLGSAVRMGPAYFPTVLGGLLGILGLVIFARSFVSKVAGDAARVHIPFGFLDFVVGLALFALLGGASKAIWGNADYGMLAASLVLSVLSILLRPASRPLVLIAASCIVFAYLVKPLGLVLATILLVVVGALGGQEFKIKEVAILAVVLAIFSVLVFVKGLTLPFPIWPGFLE